MKKVDWIKKFKSDMLLSIYLAIAPFFIYLHLLFDDESKTFNFFGYELNHNHDSSQLFIWLTINEFTSLVFLIIMFFSLNHKWKYVLFIPQSLFLLDLVNLSSFYVDFNFRILIYRIVVLTIFLISIFRLDQEYFCGKRIGSLAIRLTALNQLGNILETKSNKLRLEKYENSNNKYFTIRDLHGLYSKKMLLKKLVDRFSDYHSIARPLRGTWMGFIWIVVILVSVALRFLVDFIPEGVSSLKMGPITIKAFGFKDFSVFAWYLSLKMMIIIPLIIWYFNVSSWWRYAIFSPLILYIYQFWESFQDINSVDAHSNFKVFPLVFLSILLVIVLSRVVRQQSKVLNTYDQITEEIERLIGKLSEERTGLAEYRERYAQIVEKLLKRKPADQDLQELRRLQEELQGKIA